ncbi:MAG: Rossmann-like and DUF2520 domain-containing protein [Thermoanaerobaculia bacterium]
MIAARPLLPVPVVVGKGRLGSALAAAPAFSGRTLAHLSGREALAAPAVVLDAVRRAGAEALVLLAVRDDAIATVAATLAGTTVGVPPGPAVLHLSGALGVDALAPLAGKGFAVGSCHPLQTFSGSHGDAGRFAGSAFAVDGEREGLAAAERLVGLLGGRPVRVPPGRRGLYHLAASLGANGLTALVGASRDALVGAGLEASEALEALGPLLRAALEEALRLGPEASLTGPAARGDVATLERHRREVLAWDASRAALLEALLREQGRLARRRPAGPGC